MSTFQGHKSRITTAVSTLSKTISTVDPSYFLCVDKELPPEIQFCVIQQRKSPIAAAKLAIEKALAAQDINQFWTELQGDRLIEEATNAVAILEHQLLIDESVHIQLRLQSSKNLISATAAMTINDSPQHSSNLSSTGNHDVPVSTPTTTPTQDFPSLTMPPIQLRRLELPTFDGDVTQFYDFWCRFETAVHNNDSLSPSTKFIYLADSSRGSAA
ncbi:hypothetical protein GCK32_001201 [Trichostrongylus colubriformis]|uniref:Uncharacterized protein n=1 Tax=Trichostrongylus colubriformis TaxID=6319 RepID=A0AAN8FHR8_TRICO